MIIFFDTEFTELGIDPKLISIGLVSEDGIREFYAELSDTYQLADCSDFVREAVLPHLQGGECRMTMKECAKRLIDWLVSFGYSEQLQLATDSISWDWPWIGELFAEAGEGTPWPNVASKPLILSFDADTGERFNTALENAFSKGLRRHHALDDAKANRLGWLAAK